MVEEKNFIVDKRRENSQRPQEGFRGGREKSRLKMTSRLRGKRGREERERRGEKASESREET